MDFELTSEQQEKQFEFKAFVDQWVVPHADEFDRQERIPDEVIQELGKKGWLGAVVPREYGGMDMPAITFGLLCEEFGRGSGSLISILTVHGMVCQAISKWGTDQQKQHWLPKLATGEELGAFALTEPNIGSDATNVETEAVHSEGLFTLTGHKKWISFGQKATLFLVVAQCEGAPTSFLMERNTPGFSTEPITGLLGFRAAMLAKLRLEKCRIPEKNLLGRIGSGFKYVAGTALDHGRYCVGWACVGAAKACLDACLLYSSRRKQFGVPLKEHQLIQQMITKMIANTKAAKMLCLQAGWLKEKGEPRVIMETSIAKYFASRVAFKIAADAVQIHGANGCGSGFPVQRYLRDAKICEIIEGSTQIQQMIISSFGNHLKV